jgi:Cu(I)/Ag(I) efflux system membrane fusion protein
MHRLSGVIFIAVGASIGALGGYWYARLPAGVSAFAPQGTASAAERRILYYRDPSGAPYWSATPKQDANGRDYLPVYEDEEVSFEPGGKKPAPTASAPRKILYYRNPMGLPDTSPVPKKDWMGMDYIPVYEGEEQEDGKTVKVSLDKVQRSGVRTEMVEPRIIMRPVRAVGTVMHDEARLTVVTMRSDGFIEDLFVNRTGQHVHAGEPLFRVYSPDIQRAQSELVVSMGASPRSAGGADAARTVEGLSQRLLAEESPAVAVPVSAVIDSGTRQVVLVAKGDGRFEPRPVKLGRRGDGYVEVVEGVNKDEEVVTSATFLIDAESNLKAALQAFSQAEAPK